MLGFMRKGFLNLSRNVGFTLTAVLTLSLGIGATVAIFSIINAVLLRPLPFKDPGRLVMFWQSSPVRGIDQDRVAPANFLDWRAENRSFVDLAGIHPLSFNVTGGEEPERVRGARVSASLLPLLGVNPVLGRGFLPEEDRAGAPMAVLLGHGYWQRRFGADPKVIGQALSVNASPATVVGVMPAGFGFPNDAELWVPLSMDGEEALQRSSVYLLVLGRLKPGVSLDRAGEDMAVIAKGLEQKFPDESEGWGVALQPLHEQVFSNVRPALQVLFGAVVFVLLIGCANAANLLLARGVTREREIAIRTALGATRGDIVKQLLAESVLVALFAGALGLLLASWGIHLIIARSPIKIYRLEEAGIDPAVLGFALGVSALCGLLFGLVPALRSTSPDLNSLLKEGADKATAGVRRRLAEKSLVVSEVSLAIILLIGAGLMLRSFYQLQTTSPGFDPESRLTARLVLSSTAYPESHQRRAFFDRVVQEVSRVPGVRHAAVTTTLPLSGSELGYYFTIDGRPAAGAGQEMGAGYDAVTPGYFAAMGIPLLRGRLFTEGDSADRPPVVVISDALADLYWSGENPIGQRIRLEEDKPPLEIVGIAGNVRHASFGADDRTHMYVPYAQDTWAAMNLVLHTQGEPLGVAGHVRRVVWGVDRDQPVAEVRTMEDIRAGSVGQLRFVMVLLGVFAVVSLVLAAIGIYGVISYATGQRTHEIGVRMALGAQKRDVLGLIVGQGLRPIILGLALGLAGAYALAQVVSRLLVDVDGADPVTFAGIAAVMMLAGLLASYLPARRASRLDPLIALRGRAQRAETEIGQKTGVPRP
ncbi:MAG TPA: ABC transporter permease [Thermoanaerobaculia bacterium]|nr:ABC transporter permease [Thermoanaerobaculia bacterium]